MNQVSKEKGRILIVDDNPKNIQLLGTILKSADYLINVGRNGKQALEITKKVLPDLILLDVMMPEMDGFEACRLLKQSPETKDIPVVFLTAKAESGDIAQGFEVGAVDYVTKPFETQELLARVRTHLELKFSREMIIEQSNEQKELLHILCHDLANPFHNIQGILELLSDDLAQFETYAGYMRTTLRNGMSIIDLVRSMRSLEEKKTKLELDSFSLNELIAESDTILRQKLSEKEITIDNNIADDIVIKVEKVSFINSVINNLISNAIKFSAPGSNIKLTASRKEGMVTLSVQDYGIGMPDTILRDLFDLSKPTSRVGTNGETGTGFGMPLVRKFVEAYGGTLTIESKEIDSHPEDHGTKVVLQLPAG